MRDSEGCRWPVREGRVDGRAEAMNGTPATIEREATRFGGKPELRVFVKGAADVVDALVSTQDGGSKSVVGVGDLVHSAYDGAFDVVLAHEEPVPAPRLLAELEQSLRQGRRSRLVEARPDVVVLGVSSDLGTDPDEFRNALQAVVRMLKDDVGCHVIVQNACSVDPDDRTINYHGIEDPLSLRIHRLNLRLLELSMLEGISILDVDRIVAELGAGKHVTKVLDYSAEACEAIARELVRVLADYGFFEQRPLVLQLGRRTLSAAE
jgi:hypothetical protein